METEKIKGRRNLASKNVQKILGKHVEMRQYRTAHLI